MRADERRALLRTTLIAALLAIATSVGVYVLRSLPVAAQDRDTKFSEQLRRALALPINIDATHLEIDAQTNAAIEAWLLTAKTYGLEADLVRPFVRRDRISELNQRLLGNPKTAGFTVVALHDHVSVGRAQAAVAGVPVFGPNDGPLATPHAEDWIVETGRVSLRALAARVLSQGLLALIDRPELCPTSLRVESAHTLGSTLDALYSQVAIATAGGEAKALGEALLPLCRRERLARLADIALRKKTKDRLPFTPGFRLDTFERELLEKLQDPVQAPKLGAEARSHMNGMVYSEEEIGHVDGQLRRAIVLQWPTFARDALAEANAWAQISAAPTPPDLQLLAGANTKVATASGRALCVYENVARASPRPAAYLASVLDRFTLEDWPEEAERNAMLALLYRAAKMPMPATGIASGAPLAQIASALADAPALDTGCTALTAPAASVADLDRLREDLQNE